ncbi:hypothetical protein ABU162_26520 [Paenibacillus thiaminolyticus]|uniref:hypothetical protein n=1 Tax=Paenibacillus thiaminolyticus TaxID=49283 RepID=UPI0035A5A6A1
MIIEQGADFVLLNGNESSVFHDEDARNWLYSAIASEAFCLWEEGEFAAASFLVHRSERQRHEVWARPKSCALSPSPAPRRAIGSGESAMV